jgi:flagellar motor switch/type III secretory pathway protein FliN
MIAPSEKADFIPIRFVPQAALQSLQNRVSTAVAAWAEDWGLTDIDDCSCAVVRCRDLPTHDVAALPSAAVTLADADSLSSRASPLVNVFAKAVFQTDAHKSPIAADVAEAACAALKKSLVQQLGESACLSLACERPGSQSLGDWGVCCSITVAKHKLSLYLSVQQLAALGVMKTTARPALSRWNAANVLSDLPVTLIAELGSAEVDVVDFSNLAEGDVIVLSQSMSRPLCVRGEKTELQLAAQIGHSGVYRAIQVLAPTRGLSS